MLTTSNVNQFNSSKKTINSTLIYYRLIFIFYVNLKFNLTEISIIKFFLNLLYIIRLKKYWSMLNFRELCKVFNLFETLG